jgi:hypothetical protein
LKRTTQTKYSIALENPAYIEPEMEVNTSNFDLKQRKHGKVIKLFFTSQYTTFCKTNHASWTDIPSLMCPSTKDKDGPGIAYNEHNGKFIKLLLMLL